MQNMNQPQNQSSSTMPLNNQMMVKNRGAHELFDGHETISSIINMLDQYQLYAQYIKDPELKSIAQRQTSFVTQMYNTVVECYKTGKDPAVPTQQYRMTQNNNVIYGIKPGQPKKPNQSINEISDQGLSGFMLANTKSLATVLPMAALEINNPVLRRVLADSVPNLIEMSYEIFLYQNKHGYYQVPELTEQDTSIMLNCYTTASQFGNMTH